MPRVPEQGNNSEPMFRNPLYGDGFFSVRRGGCTTSREVSSGLICPRYPGRVPFSVWDRIGAAEPASSQSAGILINYPRS